MKRMRKTISVWVLAALLILLPGCWDEVNLQDVSYVSAIGIDYQDGQMILYGQMLNFASIAKSESPASIPAETWLGRGKGKSTLLALYDLMRGGYSSINLEHLKTVIIHERATGKIDDVLDALNRQRASRYTSLIFGTTSPIEDIFTTENFFNQSHLYSVMYAPKPHEDQYTFIEPLQMQLAVQTIKEPCELTLLPVINSSQTYWKKGKKPISTQLISGLFVFKDYKYLGYFAEKSVIGLRWLNEDFHKVYLEANADGHTGTVSIKDAKYGVDIDTAGEEPRFRLNVSLTGSLIELDGEMTAGQIESSIEETVRGQIQSLYEIGIKKGVDFLELEHRLYRYHNRFWHSHIKDKDWVPDPKFLAEIDVKFQLSDSGKYDLQAAHNLPD
ncbi:Ger(x)C family spore germination protein [Paenibacillus sp. LHD-117]|uniref:Ger(x)C family spore germination protein n=1 Tax=Paenibacillus sp. LHD-117 TaxID=3071412 RepID=UPI0027E02F37|nr:Ger(x)C family spore germination protein [Paenibacillus sp. LHD-117]MDQ6423002.1 Ger(x)C family spore germination protein [Paenibacillus sp. LHD-117]